MKYIETDKFNHVSVSIRSIFDLDIHTITTMNLLCIMMKKQTEKYPDPSLFTCALADTYGIRIGVGLSAYGKQLVMDIRMNAIETLSKASTRFIGSGNLPSLLYNGFAFSGKNAVKKSLTYTNG